MHVSSVGVETTNTLNRWAVIIMNEMRLPDVLILAWEVKVWYSAVTTLPT